jgi:hypothetical protein
VSEYDLSAVEDDRASLKLLLAALDASEPALKRDMIRVKAVKATGPFTARLAISTPMVPAICSVSWPMMSATNPPDVGPTSKAASPPSAD